MLLGFFSELRAARIPVSIRELLDLHQALAEGLAFASQDEFYQLSRAILVKDEKYYDRFDRAFATYFEGIEDLVPVIEAMIPDHWLRQQFLRQLSDEDKAKIQSLGGLDKLIEIFKQRLQEQKERHAGGNRWIGTGGTSPFGSGGYNPMGIRIGDAGQRQERATKVWEMRQFRDLDANAELGSRNIKMALRRLRKFARQGAPDELDLDRTIAHTARDGLLNIQMRPERRNAVKLLLLLDIGGSMDYYIKVCQELFDACRSEFKHLEHYYFHNFLYESVWRNSERRTAERIPTYELLNRYGRDYKVVIVGDAAMSPYEITSPGGSVEHWNEEAGAVWMRRLMEQFPHLAWFNPYPREEWSYTSSIQMVRNLIDDRMYPMTLQGLEEGMAELAK